MSDFLSAAITYAEAGLRVCPLMPKVNQRLPGTLGCTDGTTDKNIITSWWSKVPAANIGLCTGRTASGKYLVVIDLDEDELVRFLSDAYYDCPYYRNGDEDRVVRKQL